jgi:hypothetical protein
VNTVVIYIGKDEQLTIYFSQLLSSVLPESPIVHGNYKQAAEWLAAHSEEKSTVILYERDSSDADLEKIKYLRDKFPYIYILLVTDDLTADQQLKYTLSGVNDTCSPRVEAETLRQFFHFIRKYQSALQRKSCFPVRANCPLPVNALDRVGYPLRKQRAGILQIKESR